MIRRRLISAVAVIACSALLPARAQTRYGDAAPDQAFEILAAGYVTDYLATHPVRCTQLGLHHHDDSLPVLSRGALERRARDVRQWLRRLEALDRSRLSADARFDHEILEHAARAELLDLEEIRGWERNPMRYNKVLADGLASLVDRRFATLETRLAALTSRLRQFPDVIGAAKRNLRDVPLLWCEIAARNVRGTLSFLEADVPAALAEQGLDELDKGRIASYERARGRALRRLEDFATWLERELQPRADGDFGLGRELFERKLWYEEHVSTTVDELRALNGQSIQGYREWVAREAARLDPSLEPAEVMERLTLDYPEPEQLIPTARRYVEQARALVVERGLMTLPTRALPTVRPTPAYARSGFASMSTPGPFENEATESYYNITNVDPSWTPQQQAEHLTYFNHPGLLGISVHEAMPGHYVQLLYQRQLPTDVRKVFAARSLVEGWAHYVEQMMVDEGLGGGDPAVRLGQLRRALQRQARWSVALDLHVFGATLEDAAETFSEIAYFAPFPALRETQRATYDPTYLYYALGRIQILELREDYRTWRESQGQPFSLRDFHDEFLRLGLPVTLARRAMLPVAGAP